MMSEANCRKLIKLVENRPAIYNYELKQYRNRNHVQKMWEQIAAEMDLPSEECKWKWGNLRKAFTRYIRDDIAARGGKCWLSGSMEFIRQYIGHTSLKGSLLDRKDNPNFSRASIFRINTGYFATGDEEKEACKSSFTEVKPSSPSSFQMFSPRPAFNVRKPIEKQQADTTSVEQTKDLQECTSVNRPKRTEKQESVKKHPIMEYVYSMLSDIHQLSDKRQRKFKQDVLIILNRILDQEIEPSSRQMQSLSKNDEVIIL